MKRMSKLAKISKISRLNFLAFAFMMTVFQTFSYEYSKDIKVSGNKQYKEFYITEDIYGNSGNHLNDIRIINKNGKEIPYVIEKEEAQKEKHEKIVAKTKISEKIVKKDGTEFIVKFVSEDKMKDIIGNKIELTADKNFYSEYRLFGSNNGTDWENITEGEIYKTPEKQSLIINFSEKRYEYYKIITSVNKEISFSEAILKLANSEDGKFETKTVTLNFETETKDKNTILKIKAKNLPLKQIVLEINEEFKRNYTVRNRDGYQIDGTISKVGNKENLVINVSEISKTDEMTLEIQNGDNEPLKIKSIKGNYIPGKIVFKAEKNEEYKIIFGDEKLEKPQYDIEAFSDMIVERDEVLLGNLIKTEDKMVQKPKDYTIFYNIFIGIVIVALIVFMVRKIGKKS